MDGGEREQVDRLITAEQDERRRLAVALHDGPVQAMAGIALMLDAVVEALAAGRHDEAIGVLQRALARQRDTIRSLRDLSFALEPIVLRDQGFSPAVRALADQVGSRERLAVDLDVEAGEGLAERAQVALFQIIREALDQSVRRGPPTRISVRVDRGEDGSVETVITDDAAAERRRGSFDSITERARSVNGRVTVESSVNGGTAVRVVLPPYVASD